MAALDAWLVFEDEAGFSMTPPTTRTWSRRGHTPVIRVPGRSRRRSSVAALACYKAGEPSRLIYRPCPNTRPDGRKSFSWKDYRDPIQTAHQQLGGPYRAGLGQLERPTGGLQARSRAEPLQRTVHRTGAAYGPAGITPLLGQAGGRCKTLPGAPPAPSMSGRGFFTSAAAGAPPAATAASARTRVFPGSSHHGGVQAVELQFMEIESLDADVPGDQVRGRGPVLLVRVAFRRGHWLPLFSSAVSPPLTP